MAKRKTAAGDETQTPVLSYKGFDKNFQCRGFQYEVGKTYTHDGEAVLCESGFHACEAPLDVLNYYSITDSKFAQVELGGASAQKEDGDTKRAGKSIAIKLALSIADLISAQVEWTLKSADKKNVASGYSSAAASSGYSSTAASSGNSSAAASSGDYSKAACDTNGFACVAGVGGMVKGNAGSALSCGYKDAQGRLRIAVGYVGEGGINADTWYCVDGVTGLLVEVA